jgi:hypothetical protein
MFTSHINTSEVAPPEDYTSHTHYSVADSDANIDSDTPAAEDTSPRELDSDSDTPYSYTPFHINVLVVSVPCISPFPRKLAGGGRGGTQGTNHAW